MKGFKEAYNIILCTEAVKYKRLDCLGTYDTWSEIGKRKREFVCRGAEFKLRLIVLRTCTCEVTSHLYRNKLDVAERGGRGLGGEASVGGLGARPPSGSRGRAPFAEFLCRSAGRQTPLSLPISDESIFHNYNEHGSHKKSFHISNMHWIYFIPN